jgi:hypothetical protein
MQLLRNRVSHHSSDNFLLFIRNKWSFRTFTAKHDHSGFINCGCRFCEGSWKMRATTEASLLVSVSVVLIM